MCHIWPLCVCSLYPSTFYAREAILFYAIDIIIISFFYLFTGQWIDMCVCTCDIHTYLQAHSKMSNLGAKFEPEDGISFYTQDGYPNFDEH